MHDSVVYHNQTHPTQKLLPDIFVKFILTHMQTNVLVKFFINF